MTTQLTQVEKEIIRAKRLPDIPSGTTFTYYWAENDAQRITNMELLGWKLDPDTPGTADLVLMRKRKDG